MLKRTMLQNSDRYLRQMYCFSFKTTDINVQVIFPKLKPQYSSLVVGLVLCNKEVGSVLQLGHSSVKGSPILHYRNTASK